MPRQRPPRFKEREVVNILVNERTVAEGLAGLTGSVCGHAPLHGGGWDYDVQLPRRRRMVYGFVESDLVSTGRMKPKQKRMSMRIRVDPESGESSVLDDAGEPIEFPNREDEVGIGFFTDVSLPDEEDPDGDRLSGIVVAKAQQADGSWRYGILLDDEPAVRTYDRSRFYAHVPSDPGEYLDRSIRPHTEEVDGSPLLYAAVWHAPAPAFGYDQVLRVVDRPHTAPVAGRVGRVITEQLHDDMTWAYFVILDDDPTAEIQYVTAAEEDLEATGDYGEGYNPPPDWLG